MTKWRYSIPVSLLSKTTNIALTSILKAKDGFTGEHYSKLNTSDFAQFSKDFARNVSIRFNGFAPADHEGFIPEGITAFNEHQASFDKFLEKANYSKIVYQTWNQDLGHNTGKIFASSAGNGGFQDPDGYGPIYTMSEAAQWLPTSKRPKKIAQLDYNYTTDNRLIVTQQFTCAQYRYRKKDTAWRYKKTSPIAVEYKLHYDTKGVPHFKPTHIHVSNREQLGAVLGEKYRPQFFRIPDTLRPLSESKYTIAQLYVEDDGSGPLEKGIHFCINNHKTAINATIKHNLGQAQTFQITEKSINEKLDSLIKQQYVNILMRNWPRNEAKAPQAPSDELNMLAKYILDPQNNATKDKVAELTALAATDYTVFQLHKKPKRRDLNRKGIYIYPIGNTNRLEAKINVNNGPEITVRITDDMLANVSQGLFTDTLIENRVDEGNALDNTMATLAYHRRNNSYFKTLIDQWPKREDYEGDPDNEKHYEINFKGNVILRSLAKDIQNKFKHSAPDSPSLPVSHYMTDDFRYVFKGGGETYHWNLVNLAMFVPKFIAEYIPLLIADLSLLALHNYRKQSWRKSAPVLACFLIDIIPFIVLNAIHYTFEVVYWLGRTLTSPVESYKANRKIHPKFGIVMAGLSVLSTAGLSILLGLFIAPLIAPHCVLHVASTSIFAQSGNFLSVFTQALGCATQCALSAITALSSFVLFFIVNPLYTLKKQFDDNSKAESLKKTNHSLYRTYALKDIREKQRADNEALLAPPPPKGR